MKTILLIEDNQEMRENTTEILELAGYLVKTAPNGKAGLEMAQKEKPDLIVCDVMMPVLDGYGVLHMLEKNPATAGIPFIFLTAKAERADMRLGMEMGADDYITKPFDDLDLMKAVEMRLKKHEWLKKEYAGNLEGLNQFMDQAKGLDELSHLSGNATTKHFRKRDLIYNEYGRPNGLYFLKNGKIKIFRSNPDGKELITGLLHPGEFFGYLALLEDIPYTESAAALEDSEIGIISKEDFFALIYNNREVARKFMGILARHIQEQEENLLNLAYNSVRKRVADALVQLKERYQMEKPGVFSMVLSREDLGSMAGTSTESAIRTLRDFKDENLVDIKGGKITILNIEKLAGMKN